MMQQGVWVETTDWEDVKVGDHILYIPDNENANNPIIELDVTRTWESPRPDTPVIETSNGAVYYYEGYYFQRGILYVQKSIDAESSINQRIASILRA